MTAPEPIEELLQSVMRDDRGRILAALVHHFRDMDFAQDCLQEALARAVQTWPKNGVPKAASAWLLSVARRHAVDQIRRNQTATRYAGDIATLQAELSEQNHDAFDIPDHRLRLIFTCCHPALDASGRVALTLRILGGLTTQEIARAFVVKPATMAQRITRAKSKISKAGIGFHIPNADEMGARVGSVLQVIYLIYNEGYSTTAGKAQLRFDLCEEALFLAQIMVDLLPKDAEARGLLALILFSMARRAARSDHSDMFVPLDKQDRGKWDQAMIERAEAHLEQALGLGRIGPYQLQAAIHGVHCAAKHADQTDWTQIASLYALLIRIDPSPVVQVNYAVPCHFPSSLHRHCGC